MKHADINRRFTATVAEYLANGYTINTSSMGGSQGDYAHIDLTNGVEVIRILVDTFHEKTDVYLNGLEIIVGRASSDVTPNSDNDDHTIWNTKLNIIDRERFYEIGADRYFRKFYGTREEASAACRLHAQRYKAKHQGSKSKDITARAMEIAKRIIRRELSTKRIREADVSVIKNNSSYYVNYKGKTYRLH